MCTQSFFPFSGTFVWWTPTLCPDAVVPYRWPISNRRWNLIYPKQEILCWTIGCLLWGISWCEGNAAGPGPGPDRPNTGRRNNPENKSIIMFNDLYWFLIYHLMFLLFFFKIASNKRRTFQRKFLRHHRLCNGKTTPRIVPEQRQGLRWLCGWLRGNKTPKTISKYTKQLSTYLIIFSKETEASRST